MSVVLRRSFGDGTVNYERRRPEETVLFQVVQGHLESFLAKARERTESGLGYPSFIDKELRNYLQCGILAHGLARCVCQDCGFQRVVPFSCKGHVCPSCHARRMSELGAYLCDERLPAIPYRQWVMSFPRWVRIAFLRDKRLFGDAVRVFIRRVFAWQRKKAREAEIDRPLCGAVSLTQYFGGRLNANPHVHAIFCDGVFQESSDGGLRFHRLPPPYPEDLFDLTVQVGKRVARRLAKEWDTERIEEEDEALWAQERAGSVAFRGATRSRFPSRDKGLSAFVDGFSLHAGVVIEAHDRAALERLIRYAARPPFAEDRLSLTSAGHVVVKLKRPWPTTGETELVFEPLEFLQKLVALIPPPRCHQVHYYGLFAARAKVHHQVRDLVPRLASDPACGHAEKDDPTREADPAGEPERSRRKRMAWAKLLARVFRLDLETCPRCKGPMKIVAFVTDPDEVRRILTHAGLPTKVPASAPARAPPQTEWDFDGP